jgi:hypothetical protein
MDEEGVIERGITSRSELPKTANGVSGHYATMGVFSSDSVHTRAMPYLNALLLPTKAAKVFFGGGGGAAPLGNHRQPRIRQKPLPI